MKTQTIYIIETDYEHKHGLEHIAGKAVKLEPDITRLVIGYAKGEPEDIKSFYADKQYKGLFLTRIKVPHLTPSSNNYAITAVDIESGDGSPSFIVGYASGRLKDIRRVFNRKKHLELFKGHLKTEMKINVQNITPEKVKARKALLSQKSRLEKQLSETTGQINELEGKLYHDSGLQTDHQYLFEYIRGKP